MKNAEYIDQPVIIVENVGDVHKYRLYLNRLDPMMVDPGLYGIMLSDLLDHIALAYSQSGGMNAASVRRHIFKVLCDEDALKARDPERGGIHGDIVDPKPS